MADYLHPNSIENKLGLGRVPPEPQEGVIWRGMSGGEYKNLLEQGFLESKGQYNIGKTQKGLTIFSEDPRRAEMYAHDFAPRDFKASPESSAYVVGIKKPSDAIPQQGGGAGELGVRGQIPAENVVKVYRGNVFRPKSERARAVLDWQEVPVSDLREPRSPDKSKLPAVPADLSRAPRYAEQERQDFFENMGEEGVGMEYPDVFRNIERYVIEVDRGSLTDALDSEDYPDYRRVMQVNLQNLFPEGAIPVQRVEGYGTLEGRKGYKETKRFEVSPEDVVFVGSESENELIINGAKYGYDGLVSVSFRMTPRSPEKSKLPAVIDAASVAAEAARLGADESRTKGKGAAFRGLGSLARAPIFRIARLVQEGYNLLPEDYKVIEDWVDRMKETQTHELFGMDKPGIEYLKEWLGLSDSEPEGDTIPAKDAPSALGFNIDAYHGTTYLDYDEPSAISRFYEKKDVGTGLGGLNDLGHWFSESPVVASSFASGEEGNILPVKLRLKNPASYETYEDLETALSVLGKDDPLFFQEHLKSLGHDGVVIEDSFTDVPESRRDYVVFSPKNVRSRFAKFGLKESQSPYLSKAAGGFVDKPLYDDARVGGLI